MRIAPFLIIFTALVICGPAQAQNFPVTPATPTEFKKRDIGGSLGTAVIGVREAKAITYHYIAVSDKRAFVSSEGKKITAQLIAFDEGSPDKVNRPLTLIKDGNIRLLVSGKQRASVLPLTRLREEDQDFVKAIDEANQATVVKKKEGDKEE